MSATRGFRRVLAGGAVGVVLALGSTFGSATAAQATTAPSTDAGSTYAGHQGYAQLQYQVTLIADSGRVIRMRDDCPSAEPIQMRLSSPLDVVQYHNRSGCRVDLISPDGRHRKLNYGSYPLPGGFPTIAVQIYPQ